MPAQRYASIIDTKVIRSTGWNMAIINADISGAVACYLERCPEEAALLSEPLRLLSRGGDIASRRSFPMHVTAGALLVRGAEILLVGHRAYGTLLQPGGHLEPTDDTLVGAAERELVEETGIDPGTVTCVSRAPVYVEYTKVRARPEKNEPDHFHLDFGYAFTTADGDAGRIQESEVTGAGWYPLAEAERLVGHRIKRAVSTPPNPPARARRGFRPSPDYGKPRRAGRYAGQPLDVAALTCAIRAAREVMIDGRADGRTDGRALRSGRGATGHLPFLPPSGISARPCALVSPTCVYRRPS